MKEKAGQPGSTRPLETIDGALTYMEVSERLAVSLARILDLLLQTPSHEIIILPEWLCRKRRELTGRLFQERAGRFL